MATPSVTQSRDRSGSFALTFSVGIYDNNLLLPQAKTIPPPPVILHADHTINNRESRGIKIN